MAELDKDAIMQAWMQAATLGEKHAALARFVGDWEIETKSWMDGPLAPPVVSKGTVETRWLMDGRWLIDKVTAEMMGQPFNGASITGYDNVKKKYVGIWLDSMSTTMMTMEGNLVDPMTLVMFGRYDDPVSGEHDRLQRFVTRVEGDDRQVMTIHDLSAGVEGMKMMEITYTRVRR